MPDAQLLRARDLRQSSTKAENHLWEHLRDRRYRGLKFRRQHPIKEFIVDFYCHQYQLVVEVDGGIHETRWQRLHDLDRDSNLRVRGYSVVRFTNREVLRDVDEVLRCIGEWVDRIGDR